MNIYMFNNVFPIIMKFNDIQNQPNIYLYCGDMDPNRIFLTGIPFIGTSLYRDDSIHIKHDLTRPFGLNDNTVDVIQSEDVFEHIELDNIPDVLRDIYRVLKPNGYLRMSVPDYRCDVLYERSLKDVNGVLLFDSEGGGKYDAVNNKVTHGGHVWFPKYEIVKNIIEQSPFKCNHTFYHYYDENNVPVVNDIDYTKGYVSRTPDNDDRVKSPRRPMSIVVDCYKR